jgi:hypothetical protein
VIIGELMGVFLVAYGIWFSAEGVKKLMDAAKDWWRPIKGTRRYPYPVAGILLGICFVLMGLVFALSNVWAHARVLVWVGIGVFVLVLAAGIGQPRFLHPRWYGELEDRLGRKGMMQLRRAAFQTEDEDWKEIASSKAFFDEWVKRTAPKDMQPSGRGYRSGGESKPGRKAKH